MLAVRRWFRLVPAAAQANARVDLLAGVLYGAFTGLTLPFIPVMGRRLGASPLAVALLVASSAIVLLLSLAWARLLRPVHPVRLVVWPQVIGRALFLLMPLVHTPGLYVAVVVLYHGVASIASLGYARVMQEVYPTEARGRIMAIVRVGAGIAWIVASVAGGQAMQLVPFQWVFAVAGVFGVAGALVFGRMRVGPSAAEPMGRSLAGLRETLRRDPSFRRFLAAFFVFGFGAWMMGPAVPLLLVDVLHATNFQVGLLGAVAAGTSVLAFYQWGRLIDRRTAPGALVRIMLAGAVTPLVYLSALNPWMALVGGASDGLAGSGIELGWLAAVLQLSPPGAVAHYVAIFNTLLGIRASTAPFLTGVLVPYIGVRPIFAIALVCTLAGAYLMRRVSPRAGEEPSAHRGSTELT